MTKQINRIIANGKPLAIIKKLLREEYLRLDRVKFDEAMRAEYDKLFPVFNIGEEVCLRLLDMPEKYNEIKEHFEIIGTNEELLTITYKIPIDYSEDENYVTFEEYKNETRVITEAVEATYDENGNVLTEAIPEVTELVRPYVGLTDEELEAKADEYIKSKYAELRANAYPAIEEQLDMQYKDSLDGGTRFKDAIEAVKLMYPKD